MATTRSRRKAMGAAAPSLNSLPQKTSTVATKERVYRTVTIDEIPDGSPGFEREGSADLDIPGSFAASPVDVGGGTAKLEIQVDQDEVDERIAAAHISTLAEESTDDESCPSGASIAGGPSSSACPQQACIGVSPYPSERIGVSPYPSARANDGVQRLSVYPNSDSTFGRSATPTSTPSAQVAYGASNTLFETPGRRARMYAKTPGLKLDGAKYFTSSVLDTENHSSFDNPEEERSDETLKLTSHPKRRKSNGQQKQADIAYLKEILGDDERRRSIRLELPDIIRNDKSLLEEMEAALYDSSGYESNAQEYEPYLAKSYEQQPQVQVWKAASVDTRSRSTPEAGPSYFDKGKWVRDEDFEANEAYKSTHIPAIQSPSALSEGRKKKKKNKSKRPRPSLGLTVDEMQPNKPHNAEPEPARGDTKLRASLAALPAGGYFAEKMRAKSLGPDYSYAASRQSRKKSRPPSDPSSSDSSDSSDESDSSSESSDSSSESSDSSDPRETWERRRKSKNKSSESYRRHHASRRDRYREENKELKRKLRKARKAQRAGTQLIKPTPYDGCENYDIFEKFDYETDQWWKDSGLSDRKAVGKFGSHCLGKAATWYMDEVAPNPKKWTMDTLKIGLYNHCFPHNMKNKLRREYNSARQRDLRFLDYARLLKRYQRRIPDIRDRDICLKLWDTVQDYIQDKWLENGINPETTSLDEMCESAGRYEAAEMAIQKRLEERRRSLYQYTKSQPEGRESYSPDEQSEGREKDSRRTSSRHLTRPQQARSQSPRPSPGSSQPGSNQREQKSRSDRPKQARKSDRPKLSIEERNELRAAGKCFLCREHGHTAKDCPSRNTAKPTGLFSAAIRPDYDLIEQLRKEREMVDIPVASIRPENSNLRVRTSSRIQCEPSTADEESDWIAYWSDSVDEGTKRPIASVPTHSTLASTSNGLTTYVDTPTHSARTVQLKTPASNTEEELTDHEDHRTRDSRAAKAH
ncbi:Pol polyprotein/retrotransposon [Ceratobasidium sp. AG-Ba]|nr:Pol polyprotein/retrotransposon [Ceratobasidium sp. AG-Ba]